MPLTSGGALPDTSAGDSPAESGNGRYMSDHQLADSYPDKNPEDSQLWDSSSDLLLITDPYGLFVKVSAAAKKLLGYEPGGMEGHLPRDSIPPADPRDTRDETRMCRRHGRPRHFYCRYMSKSNRPVELSWTGSWDEEKAQYVFVGRLPRASERLPFIHRLDFLDGFQVCKGLFALSLVFAFVFDLGNNSTFEVRRLFEAFNGDTVHWVSFMAAYALASLLCLVWKHRWFQFGVSVISIFIWIWMGVVTLLAPNYVAAAGIYEVMLGIGSICVLYYRGRQL